MKRVLVLLVVLASSFALGKDKRTKFGSAIVVEKDGETVSSQSLQDGTTFTRYQVTNFILTAGGAHLTVVCQAWHLNHCIALSAGQNYTVKFYDMTVSISAKPSGYNLLRVVEFKSRVVDAR